MKKDELINVVAPALRGLLSVDGRLALVSYEDGESGDGNVVSCKLPDEVNAAQVVSFLQDHIGGLKSQPDALIIENVGTFKAKVPAESSGRVAGKVAVVTGAAQGFGYEIACNLAGQGAVVVLADINLEGVRSAAAAINSNVGADVAIGIQMNVTDGASVSEAVAIVVRTFGGIDIFIANAGVVKAGSVKEISEKDFDFVTNVNYKGYYLCVQKVAPVMAVQHEVNTDYMSDIIQINSKSGLAGSNKNGAYAGSKFGGIGLTQSFAMELITDGIKVNSICPGNFFDGPLWSHPENGLFAQYLRSGKVPGAKSIEDVKKSYEAKVPMGRGCSTADVMHAVYYIVDQKYETGQAVPVTGGQVMLT